MSKEHLAIALALSVPVVVCITKVRHSVLVTHLYASADRIRLLRGAVTTLNTEDRHDPAERAAGDDQAGDADTQVAGVQVRCLSLSSLWKAES